MFPVFRQVIITINSNMVICIYSYEEGFRFRDNVEYSDFTAWEKDLMILKFRGAHVGHKIYSDITLKEFESLSETQKNNLPCKAQFDKEAFLRKH